MPTLKVPTKRKKGTSIMEATEKIYNDAEKLLISMHPEADRTSDAFKDTVFRLASSAMIDLFVRLRK